MRLVTTILAAVLSLAALASAPATAATPRDADFASLDLALRWVGAYRDKPDPAGVPVLVRALSRMGAFKDPEQAGAYTGFIAGVINANPSKAEHLINKMLPLPPGDQWVVVRAIAYSSHPDWRNLMRRVAAKVPARQVMIEKHLAGTLPTLWQIPLDQKPSTWETVRSYVTLEKLRGKEPPKEVTLDSSPELLDTFWGYYFATSAHRPVNRIITMLPMSKDNESVEKLTLGNMAKFTLASNASRDMTLLGMLKSARERETKENAKIITEVIDAAEAVELTRLRKEAMASIEELRRKGPGSRRSVSLWGQVGQGALALGCIAAAATGHIEFGLPCIITGGVSSAALNYWDKNPP